MTPSAVSEPQHTLFVIVLLGFWAGIGPLAGYLVGHALGYRNGTWDENRRKHK